jgi:hypothetical protein
MAVRPGKRDHVRSSESDGVSGGDRTTKHRTTSTENTAMRATRLTLAFAVGFASLILAATVPAQSNTSGTVTLESKAVAIGVGVSWGDGTLAYSGKQHKFSVEGLSMVDLGVSRVKPRAW